MNEDFPEEITFLTLRWGQQPERKFTLPAQDTIIEQSRAWSYLVWKRRRWRDSAHLVEDLANRARQTLDTFGIGLQHIVEFACTEVIEIGIPYTPPEQGSDYEERAALQLMPWEFLLTAATSSFRAGEHLLVVRRLVGKLEPLPSERTTGAVPLLFVQSLPGKLRDRYLFDTEIQLVQRALQADEQPGNPIRLLKTPTVKRIGEEIAKLTPEIVHFSGMDRREGDEALQGTSGWEGWKEPGFYLQRDTEQDDRDADTDPAGSTIGKSKKQPEFSAGGTELGEACGFIPKLVAINCYHSGTLAAEAVRCGTESAIGFQDEVDNPLVELFFAVFYHGLLQDGRFDQERLLHNFHKAMEATRREKATEPCVVRGRLRGTGVILWTRNRLALDSLPEPGNSGGTPQFSTASPESTALSPGLEFDIRPHRNLNYSLLHNDRSLFERFAIKTKVSNDVPDIRITVDLDAAGARYTYSKTTILTDFYANLSRIHVSLTAELLRNLRESVTSSLHVMVDRGSHVIYEDTHRILLLPVNEWKDDKQNRVWLPSFVLPNDPAVVRITKASTRYLQAISDDPKRSFDGYQAATPTDTGPVHLQVQAIWNSLLHDFGLSYVNPPPSFEVQSQRIRTPTQILEQERGTCLDLALLMAACLEYLDIYPVIFLLTGHAFMGYFTHSSYQKEFGELFAAETLVPWSERGLMPPQPWVLEKDFRREMRTFVEGGKLMPVETTFITRAKGFAEATNQGRKNLTDSVRFEAIFDIRRARDNRVLPLPIGGSFS